MIHCGDCLGLLRSMDENSVDSIVTDPPYGLRFMGKKWDYDVPSVEVWAECLRVLKPGGYLLSFGGTRTYHRLATRIEDAGFILHPMLGWLFGSGFPKATRIADAPELDGWRYGLQSLKPAMEPIAMAQKPFSEKTGSANIARWGTGAINIDGCRVSGGPVPVFDTSGGRKFEQTHTQPDRTTRQIGVSDAGRWPANVIHDGSDEVLAVFPDAPGQMADARTDDSARKTQNVYGGMKRGNGRDGEASANTENAGVVGFKMRPGSRRADEGTAARFFYCAKPSRAERDAGLEAFERVACGNTSNTSGQHITRRDDGYEVLGANDHPTVKPIALMRYLCRLVTPRGGLILDPYTGSGSTGCGAVAEGFQFVGAELGERNCDIARARIAATQPGLGF